MGLVHADITLRNPLHQTVYPVQVCARVDESAMQMCIPAEVVLKLGLRQIEKRDGVTYVGVQVVFEERNFFTGALVRGHEVVLGRLAMAELEDGVVKPVVMIKKFA